MRRLSVLPLLLATAACATTAGLAVAASYFDISDITVDEDAGQASFTIVRKSGPNQTASIRVATRNGTALAGTDYIAREQTYTFTPGQKTATFTVPLVNDAIKEGVENFNAVIRPLSNARLWGDGNAFALVTDIGDVNAPPDQGGETPPPTVCPDGSTTLPCPPVVPTLPPSLSVDDVTIAEGATNIPITIRKHGTLNSLPSTFTLTTVPGTATAPADYTAQGLTITLAANELSRTVLIPMVDDNVPEPTEHLTVVLTAGANSRLYDGTALVTITDADVAPEPPPVMTPPTVSMDPRNCAEAVGNCTVTLWRTGDISGASSANWATATTGTATAGSDFTASSGTATWAAGVQQYNFNVPILNDAADENDETVNITLTPVSNITIGSDIGNLTIQDDDDPAQPPQQQVDIPSPTLAGNALNVPHDYNLDVVGGEPIPPSGNVSGEVQGAYRQICGDGFLRKMDPILYPGQEVGGHLHDFSGDKGVDDDSTQQTLLASGESTCNDMPGTGRASQNAVYWITALLDGVGNVVRPDYNNVYYKRVPVNSTACGTPADNNTKQGICIPFPNGLRMISGSKLVPGSFTPLNYRTDGGRPVYFNCHGTGAVNGRYANLASAYASSPTCPNLTVVVEFPTCWNGTHLWKVDRSHIVYARYNNFGVYQCPTTHPYLIPSVTIHYEYRTDANWATYKLASDDMYPAEPRGWSLHADAWLVWDERIKQEMEAGCINQFLNCSGGQLGNGRRLKGANQPTYGFTNPNRLTPISSLPVADQPDHTGH